MKIYTYYVACPGHNREDELKLITLWREAWTRTGGDPFVLSEWHAARAPEFSEYNNAVSQLPTANSAAYERACFIRWLALAQAGGGWMMDYDVFPNQLDNFPQWTGAQIGKLQLMQTNCVCPCLLYASAETAKKACRVFAGGTHGRRTINGSPHYSDQYALCDLVDEKADWIEFSDFVLGYGDDGWEKSPAVHFSNSAMGPRGKAPRWKFIPEILDAVK